MSKGIPIDQLDKETLKKLGLDGIGSQLQTLSHVLDSVRNAQKDDAIWALQKALAMLDDSPKEKQGENYAEWVLLRVAEYYGFLPDDLIAKGRSPDVVIARQVVMYVLWKSNRLTMEVIGKSLGGRTPATVSWGAQQIQKVVSSNPKLSALVNELLKAWEDR